MAKQVKPFESLFCMGYFTWVWWPDEGLLEPEGMVYFTDHPKLGDTAVLSDGGVYEVIAEPNNEMEIKMRRKDG